MPRFRRVRVDIFFRNTKNVLRPRVHISLAYSSWECVRISGSCRPSSPQCAPMLPIRNPLRIGSMGAHCRLMNVVITGGPSSEPIDQVRLITNRSTGELGVILAEAFWNRGHQVTLVLGRLSQFRHSRASYFDRNEDLQRMLGEIKESKSVNVVLHAAALADFQVTAVRAGGDEARQKKKASGH